jgi:ankyrin repeat protein
VAVCAEIIAMRPAAVKHSNDLGYTPLIIASRLKTLNPALVRLLCDYGCDVNAVTKSEGYNALMRYLQTHDLGPFS